MDRNGPLINSDQYSITGDQLMIDSISALSVEEEKAIRCSEVLSNGIVVTGEEYKLKALGICCVLRCVCYIRSVYNYGGTLPVVTYA